MTNPESMKLFTVKEAEQLLPKITQWMRDIQRMKSEIERQETEIDALELIAEPGKDDRSNQELAAKIKVYQAAIEQVDERIDEVLRLGCVIKDIDVGLIDFYSRYQDRVVYLCWKVGEAHIGYWHELGQGYRSRQALENIDNPRQDKG